MTKTWKLWNFRENSKNKQMQLLHYIMSAMWIETLLGSTRTFIVG